MPQPDRTRLRFRQGPVRRTWRRRGARPARARRHPDLAALLAGRRRRRVRAVRDRARRRAGGDRQLPGQGPHARRAAVRRRTRRSRSSPAATASTCTRSTASSAAAGSIAIAIGPEHFAGWIDWAQRLGIGLDFNPTFFSHPKAADNFTLSHADPGDPRVLDRPRHRLPAHRRARSARRSGTPCITNVWIPDGMKDTPVDRVGPRERLLASLDAIFDENDRPGAQPRRGRGQAVRHRLRELHRRLARVLLRLRADARQAADPRRRPLPPDRDHHRQDQLGADVPARDAAARQPRRPLGQRPRRRPQRRARGDRAGAGARATSSTACTSGWTTSTPASTASRPGPSARATCSRRC